MTGGTRDSSHDLHAEIELVDSIINPKNEKNEKKRLEECVVSDAEWLKDEAVEDTRMKLRGILGDIDGITADRAGAADAGRAVDAISERDLQEMNKEDLIDIIRRLSGQR